MAQPLRWEERLGRRTFLEFLREQVVTERQLAAVLRDAAIDSERMVAATLGDGIGAQIRREQYRQTAAALRRRQGSLWRTISDTTREGIDRATRVAVQSQGRLAQFLGRVAVQEGIPNAHLLRQGIVMAAETSAERVRARLISRIDLSPRVYRNADLAAGRIDRIVNRGIAQNKSAREIARSVRHLIRPDTPGGVSYSAMRLGRTELNNAFHATSVQAYDANPFVHAAKWTLSGSHPREDVCDELAESDADKLGAGVFKVEHIPSKPHPNCLCFTTAITIGQDAFNERLLAGDFDPWLTSNGYVGLSVDRSAIA